MADQPPDSPDQLPFPTNRACVKYLPMECPACKHTTEFTRMFYLKHPLGRFTCAQCGAKYQHDRPRQYYVLSVLYVLAVIGFAAAIIYTMTYFTSNEFLISLVYWGWLVFMSLLWFYFDHKYESKLPTRLR